MARGKKPPKGMAMMPGFVEAFHETQEHDPHVVQTEEHLKELVELISSVRFCAIDTETTITPKMVFDPSLGTYEPDYTLPGIEKPGTHRYYHRCCGISVCPIPSKYSYLLEQKPSKEHEAMWPEVFSELRKHTYYIPLITLPLDYHLPLDVVLGALKPLFVNPALIWLFHGYRFDDGVCDTLGLQMLPDNWHCSIITTWLHDPRPEFNRKTHKKEFGHRLKTRGKEDVLPLMTEHVDVKTFQEAGGKEADVSRKPLSDAAEYARNDAWLTGCLPFIYLPKQMFGHNRNLYEFERQKNMVAARIEERGIRTDQTFLLEMRLENEKKLKESEKKMYELLGMKNINLVSPTVMERVFFDDYGLPETYGRGTDKNVMLPLARDGYPICTEYVTFRKYNVISKFLNRLTAKGGFVNEEDVIFLRFNPEGTETGRASSDGQNWPRGEIRKGFTAREGYTFCSSDLSQIELRVMASISRDPKLMDAYNNDKDIHTRTALVVAQAGGKTYSEDTLVELYKKYEEGDRSPQATEAAELRRRAKPVNFGYIYGMSAKGFQAYAANSYGVYLELEECEAVQKAYFIQYAGVKRWHHAQEHFVNSHGYVQTLIGRKRPIFNASRRPDPNNSTREERAEYNSALRIAWNSPVQGTASDIIWMNMIELDKKGYRMLAQIHDEVLIEVPEDAVDKARTEIEDIMCNTASLRVPIRASVAMGQNWYDCH